MKLIKRIVIGMLIATLSLTGAIVTLPQTIEVVQAASLSTNTASVAVEGTATINLYGNYNKQKVKWKSSNGNIKIVKKNKKLCVIEGVKEGNSVLTAKIAGQKLKCKVTVTKKEIVSYEVTDQILEYHKNSYSDGGYYYALIEITNTGNVPLTMGNAKFDLEDINGHLVGTEDGIAESPGYLYPGDKGYYWNLIESVDMTEEEFNKLVFVPHINPVKATKSAPIKATVYDETLSEDGSELIGRVRNDTDKEISLGDFDVFIYNKEGQILSIGIGSFGTLKPGEEETFSITTFHDYDREDKTIANYKIVAQSMYYG